MAEEMIKELEDIQIETFQNEPQSKKKINLKKGEKSIMVLWDNFKSPNIHVYCIYM